MSGSWCHLVPADEAPCSPKPQDLEAPPAHTFKMTSFKKVKACGICRQAITRQGSTCRGELGLWACMCMGTCQGGQDIGDVCACLHARGYEGGNVPVPICAHTCACVLRGRAVAVREYVRCLCGWEGGRRGWPMEALRCRTCTWPCVSFMHVQWVCSSHHVCAHGCGSVHTRGCSPPELTPACCLWHPVGHRRGCEPLHVCGVAEPRARGGQRKREQ